MQITYRTFEIAIVAKNGLKFLEVVACDMQSAHADVREAYGADVEIASTVLL